MLFLDSYKLIHVCLQSLAVGDAAYNCHWYERTNIFKRYIILILVRSQKPLHLSAGALWKLTIEFFSEVKFRILSLFKMKSAMSTHHWLVTKSMGQSPS
jgi:hypothetical protein